MASATPGPAGRRAALQAADARPDGHPEDRRDAPDLSAALHDASNELTSVLGWVERAEQASTLEQAREALEVLARRAAATRARRLRRS